MQIFSKGKTTIKELPTIARPAVAVETLTSIDPSVLEDSFVYVHCYFRNTFKDMLIRIRKTTV